MILSFSWAWLINLNNFDRLFVCVYNLYIFLFIQNSVIMIIELYYIIYCIFNNIPQLVMCYYVWYKDILFVSICQHILPYVHLIMIIMNI